MRQRMAEWNALVDFSEQGKASLLAKPARKASITMGVRADLVYRERLGEVAGYTVHTVNGTLIRNIVDVDFRVGGNSGRYEYVPADEIWIDECLGCVDRAAVLIGQVTECRAMSWGGSDCDSAHELANEQERDARIKLATMEDDELDVCEFAAGWCVDHGVTD
jgi:hypothetical protein